MDAVCTEWKTPAKQGTGTGAGAGTGTGTTPKLQRRQGSGPQATAPGKLGLPGFLG